MSLREQIEKQSLGMSRKTISLSAHNPNWSKAFLIARETLIESISSELDLHHIGSTSIPNIHAKPILDILGIVPSIQIFDNFRAYLEALGFVWKGEYGIANRRYCVLYDKNEEFGLIHLHVFEKNDSEVEKHIVFRDYLRASPEASFRYQELKMKLAEAHSEERTKYSEGKSDLIAEILNEAFEWKKLKIARHETGHALMTLRFGQRIQEISLKGIASLSGAEKYRAFLKLEPDDPGVKFTGEKAIQRIMIALGGYASEILFYDVANIGGDDLAVAAKITEDLLQIEDFKKWVSTLQVPEAGSMNMIKNPFVRSYLNHKMGDCIDVLEPVKPAIELIAKELCEKDELTGDIVNALFCTEVQPHLDKNHLNNI